MATNSHITKTLAENIRNDPSDSFSKFALALEFLKQDHLQRAKMLFENIYRNDPDYLGVYYHLGKLYEQLDQPDAALQKYNEGIKIARNKNEKRTLHELNEAHMQLKMELEGN